ncbi:MAG TPA: hypothetical protein VH325_19020 [Bryobacteraceae bacterium]|nr:hypothetical protein [Bryobacteraceae bacterium]
MKTIKFQPLFLNVVLFVALPAIAAGPGDQGSPRSLLDLDVHSFSSTGVFDEILERFAVEIRPTGVIGFKRATTSNPNVTISIQGGTTVEDVLKKLCAADGRYKFVASQDPRVIDILPVSPAPEDRLLELRLPQFDMSTDAWSDNWYQELPDFSAAVRAELVQYYGEHRTLPQPSGLGGANMQTDKQPPHIDLHLKNVTVRDVLNALASKGLDWAARENESNRAASRNGVYYPVFSEGWQLKIPNANDLPIENWIHSVFVRFP